MAGLLLGLFEICEVKLSKKTRYIRRLIITVMSPVLPWLLSQLAGISSKLTAANAGHEYPVFTNEDGAFELYKDKHGLPIGAMDGSCYHEYTLMLPANGKLFVYTDGVPEATAANHEMFGTEQILDSLNANRSAAPEGLLHGVSDAVAAFVGEAEQFDDLTMLCLAYKGGEKRNQTHPADRQKSV